MTKKRLVLVILFILPLVAYLFFSSGINNFAKLPKLKNNITTLENLSEESKVDFENKITLLSFFGKDFDIKKVYAFNVKEKIYDRYHEFKDFQVVSVITPDQVEKINAFKAEIDKTSSSKNWKFLVLESENISKLFKSLNTDLNLDQNLATNLMFIIDKKLNLRGRSDDEDEGIKYGYDMSNLAEISDKFNDDVKIILAEYRLALKKYKAKRQ
ncbi:redoxin domain-containing protein [Psychroflexus sp. ALD_RP9]|uniref:redoxin domain-containing protein n=1 Tax=Psychroflexus sp. ALD_RP9 TaxID=2777186 RepID=UPI001A9054C8|nr:redoxin domain-containing protein [Psychroflexus sp. ALD_RP9]QSS96142.1 redoxin domain-containing protein [Psychroflexus sp. ALD_RP9]